MRLCKGQRGTHRREARHLLFHINSRKEEPHTGHYRLSLKEKPAELFPRMWEVLGSIPTQQKNRTGSAQHGTCWPASSCSREFHMGARKADLFSHMTRAVLQVHPASPDLSKLDEQLWFHLRNMKLSLSELIAVVQSGSSVLRKSPLT